MSLNVRSLTWSRLSTSSVHNTCADTVPPNEYPGCDVLVTPPGRLGKRFDAKSGNVVWEFKTLRFASYPPFLRDSTIKKDVQEGGIEKSIAHQCGLGLYYAVADLEHYAALVASGFLYVPDKLILTAECLMP